MNPSMPPGKKIRRLCMEALREIGPTATYEQILERLAMHGLKVSEKTFHKNYREMFPWNVADRNGHASSNGEQVAPIDGDPQILDFVPQEVEPSRLSEFLKFAVAVEAVGGIKRAKSYLEVLERLGRVI